MKQLNCETQPLTKEELKAALKRRAELEMVITFTVLPVVLCNKSEVKDLNEILGNDTFINPLKSESYEKLILKRLPLYDEWGLLDL